MLRALIPSLGVVRRASPEFVIIVFGVLAYVPDITITNPVSGFHHVQGVCICEDALIETKPGGYGIGRIEVSIVLPVVFLFGDNVYDRAEGEYSVLRWSYGVILDFFLCHHLCMCATCLRLPGHH